MPRYLSYINYPRKVYQGISGYRYPGSGSRPERVNGKGETIWWYDVEFNYDYNNDRRYSVYMYVCICLTVMCIYVRLLERLLAL